MALRMRQDTSGCMETMRAGKKRAIPQTKGFVFWLGLPLMDSVTWQVHSSLLASFPSYVK